MTQEELRNVFKYIVKKCDMLINNDKYEADDYTQDTIEDIAEICNQILDGDFGKISALEVPDGKMKLEIFGNIYEDVEDTSREYNCIPCALREICNITKPNLPCTRANGRRNRHFVLVEEKSNE